MSSPEEDGSGAQGGGEGGAPGQDLDRLQENLARVEQLSLRLVQALSARRPIDPSLHGPSGEIFAKAAASGWREMIENPTRMFEMQATYWAESVRHFAEAQQAALQGQPAEAAEGEDPLADDRRFSNPLWRTHPYFSYVRRQYAANRAAIEGALAEMDGLDETETRRLSYFVREILDLMCPTNFAGTNPDVLERAVETEGESLVKGLENLVADIEAGGGELVVRLADDSAFTLGENIATAPGEVVHRNRMMELIQYAPATDEVREIPLVIFPPWINKYYILDLSERNSLIRWITAQGYTLFVASWVNPDASHAETGLEDYLEEGYFEAMRVAKEITGQAQVNAVGYCIAGTALHLALALMARRGDDSARSATFLTTLADFSDPGEFVPFLQDDFVDGIEREVREHGILRSFLMGRTMSFLRSRDLIYGPAIRSYMMGESPPAFDLLYWNGDGANLPGRMTMQYLRELCQRNAFAGEGVELLGETLRIGDVAVPTLSVACERDHIAAWRDCHRGFVQTGSRDRTFILAESGHVAGIVNPPGGGKYGHYTGGGPGSAEEWRASATRREGSWWPEWEAWLRARSGALIPARDPGDSRHPPLCPAPGEYVRMRASP